MDPDGFKMRYGIAHDPIMDTPRPPRCSPLVYRALRACSHERVTVTTPKERYPDVHVNRVTRDYLIMQYADGNGRPGFVEWKVPVELVLSVEFNSSSIYIACE